MKTYSAHHLHREELHWSPGPGSYRGPSERTDWLIHFEDSTLPEIVVDKLDQSCCRVDCLFEFMKAEFLWAHWFEFLCVSKTYWVIPINILAHSSTWALCAQRDLLLNLVNRRSIGTTKEKKPLESLVFRQDRLNHVTVWRRKTATQFNFSFFALANCLPWWRRQWWDVSHRETIFLRFSHLWVFSFFVSLFIPVMFRSHSSLTSELFLFSLITFVIFLYGCGLTKRMESNRTNKERHIRYNRMFIKTTARHKLARTGSI